MMALKGTLAPEGQNVSPEGQTSPPSDPNRSKMIPGRYPQGAQEVSGEPPQSGPRGGQEVTESLEEAPRTPRSSKVIPTSTSSRIKGVPWEAPGRPDRPEACKLRGSTSEICISCGSGEVRNMESMVYTILLKGRPDSPQPAGGRPEDHKWLFRVGETHGPVESGRFA